MDILNRYLVCKHPVKVIWHLSYMALDVGPIPAGGGALTKLASPMWPPYKLATHHSKTNQNSNF